MQLKSAHNQQLGSEFIWRKKFDAAAIENKQCVNKLQFEKADLRRLWMRRVIFRMLSLLRDSIRFNKQNKITSANSFSRQFFGAPKNWRESSCLIAQVP